MPSLSPCGIRKMAGIGWKGWLAIWLLAAAWQLPHCKGQQLCPGTKTVHCSSCPNQCTGDNCLIEAANLVKCEGSSWGNTNRMDGNPRSTYMSVGCDAPAGVTDNFPFPAVTEPALRSPLECTGQLQRGLWPFDADNMSFAVDTFFRDQERPDININTVFLPCLTLKLKVVSSIYQGEITGTEGLACRIPQASLAASRYTGVDVYVCVDTDLSLDPLCRSGVWKTVSAGVCVGERVSGQIRLPDTGGRTLVRIGGPAQLTGCQPKWELSIERDDGLCAGVIEGLGSCCTASCINSPQLSNFSCICRCPMGYTGLQCDRTAPHLLASILVFNKTLSDWYPSTSAEVGLNQPENQFQIQTALSNMLRVPTMYVEFADAEPASNEGTGVGGTLGLYASVPPEEGGRRAVRPGCTRLLGADGNVQGSGLSRVHLRVLSTFEHELRNLADRLEAGMRAGELEARLEEQGIGLCVMDVRTRLFNSLGFELQSRLPVTPSDSLSTVDILLIVFVILGALVVLSFFFLQVLTQRMLALERARALTQHKPVGKVNRRTLGWRYVTKGSEVEVMYPAVISKVLEKAYLDGWMDKRQNEVRYFFHDRMWTADFAQMRAFEDEEGVKGFVRKVIDNTTFEMEESASDVDGFYQGKVISITHKPDGTPLPASSAHGKEATVRAYVGLSRQVLLAEPLIPSPQVGCQWSISGGTGHGGVDILPPGITTLQMGDFKMEEMPDRMHWKQHKAWLRKSHERAKLRYRFETHYPVVDTLVPPPPEAP